MPVNDKKRAYAAKLKSFLLNYKRVFIVSVDNVSSAQMQQVRIALRGTAEVLMGKNTTIRRVFRDFARENPDHPALELLEHVNGNIGFVFTNADLTGVRDILTENRVPAPARVGAVAPCDVFVEAGPTGCDPGQTQWFQALNIATKISRGQIEIVSRMHLINEGDKVGNSEAALLQKLNIRPFTYGIELVQVYDDGELFAPAVLDMGEDDIVQRFTKAAGYVAALSMQIGYPTRASLVHTLNNAFKMCLAVGIGTDYKFKQVTAFEDFLKNPGAFAPAAAGGASGAEAAVEEEEEEEEEVEGAGGLFGDDEEDDDW